MTLYEILKKIIERGDPFYHADQARECNYCKKLSYSPDDDTHYEDCVWKTAKEYIEKQEARRE